MHRVSTGFSAVAVTAIMALFLLVPRGVDADPIEVVLHRADFSSSRIDPMPVGTARQMVRIKRTRASRKA